MKLVNIGCEGYKPFRMPLELSLRPLTVLLGRNNSGKTALLRLPRLLLRCMSSRAGQDFPLQVDDVSYGKSFTKLIHQECMHGQVFFSAKLEHGSGCHDLRATVQNLFDSRSGRQEQVLSRLELSDPAVFLEWERTPDKPARYGSAGSVAFHGFLPLPSTDSSNCPWDAAAIDRLRRTVQELEDATSHLGSQRAAVHSVHERAYGRTSLRSLGIDGKGATSMLAEQPSLLEDVGEWYEKNMDGWRMTMNRQGSACSFILQKGSTTVNLAEAGQGMQQVLPVAVQQLAHRDNVRESFLDLVEEPELHLHPAAHAALADLFLESAAAGGGSGQAIVETHSENLLLRIRRRVAEGTVDPKLVAVYWIEDKEDGSSTVQSVEIMEDGSVDFWPTGVFSEGYQEVRELRRAAARRKTEMHP